MFRAPAARLLPPSAIRNPGLRRLALAGAVLGIAGCAPALEPAPVRADPGDVDARVLLVGLDGADWEIADPLMREGRMPNLARLTRTGARAKLLSIPPLLSPVVWTTVATGVEPTRHGVLDFLAPDDAGAAQPVTSRERRVPAVWEMLSARGVEVGVVGWWASWPADPVRGYLVSDRVAYQLFGYRADPADARGKTWPPGLYSAVRSRIVEPANVPWERVLAYLDGPRTRREEFSAAEAELLDGLRVVLAAGDTQLAVATALREDFRPGLEVVYFEGTDTAAHLFMPYRPPAVAGSPPESAESFAAVVDRAYEEADRHLGRLLEGRQGANVIVLSDHGFATGAGRPQATDSRIGHGAAADWHRRFGMLVMAGPAVRSGVVLDEARVYDVAPTVLALFGEPVPRSWPGRVLEGALRAEFLERRPVRYREDEPRREPRAVAAGGAGFAAEDLLDKLRALGYVSGAETDGAPGVAQRNNTGLSLMGQGRHAEAEREFRAALAERPGAPLLLVNLAVSLRHQQRNAEAAALLEQALASPRVRHVAGVELARIRLGEGDPREAERLAREVLAIEPAAADAHETLALALEGLGDLAGAERHFLEAARLDPHAATARNNLGNLEKRRGGVDRAEHWYLRAIEADPFLVAAYGNLALLYQERGETGRAVDLYERALGKSPEHPVVLNNLGSLHFEGGDLEHARALWLRASRADPGYAAPLSNLAGLAIVSGDPDEAEALLHRALAIDSGYGDARVNLAQVLRERGATDLAREQLRLAADDPRSGSRPWTELGRLERDAGRPEAAAAAWRRALELEPGNVEARRGLEEIGRTADRPGG
jgi:Tfp pilus assembly protein PilF/arylsulfatase A-like enzyme